MNETNTRPIAMQIGLPAGHLVTQPPGHPGPTLLIAVARFHRKKGPIMKALVLTGVKEFEIQDLPTPEIQPNGVLINTASRRRARHRSRPVRRPPRFGRLPRCRRSCSGHEKLRRRGRQIGAEVTGVKVGDRVAVHPNIYRGQCEYCLTQRPEPGATIFPPVGVTRDGGLAEQFTAPATVVYKLPDNVSLRDAAAIEPISCAVHGVDLLKLRPYQKALVIGDGFMGELFAQIVQAYGVHQVDLAGIFDEKLKRNQELFGVTNVYNTTREAIPAESDDVIIEAVGFAGHPGAGRGRRQEGRAGARCSAWARRRRTSR